MPGASPTDQLLSAGFALCVTLLQQIITNQGPAPVTIPVITWTAYLETLLAEQNDELQRLQALSNFQQNANTQLISQLVDIKSAIANLGGGVVSVTLPPSPPPGYGGPSTDQTASAIWGYIEPGETRPQGYWQVVSGWLAQHAGSSRVAFTSRASPFVLNSQEWNEPHGDMYPFDGPSPDPADIDPDEDLYAWLNRTSGFAIWGLNTTTHFYEITAGGTDLTGKWICNLTEQDFERLKSAAIAARLPAPVWPGLDLVTLGDEVALVDQMELDGPMHGVIVRLSATPTSVKDYVYGDRTAVLQIGALTFKSDNGQVEHVSALGFDNQVYSPKAMAKASSVLVRLRVGVSGTIQPWAVTA